MMLHPMLKTVLGCDSSYRAADIVLYGAPFDSTTSYRPGARFGPSCHPARELRAGDLQPLSGRRPDRL